MKRGFKYRGIPEKDQNNGMERFLSQRLGRERGMLVEGLILVLRPVDRMEK